MRFLWVGDPHAEVHDLEDCAALMDRVLDLAEKHGAIVILAGDLYHTHAIIHAEVQYFWWQVFDEAERRKIDIFVLKGNHDAPGTEGSKATALIAHISQCTTVLYEPMELHGVLFCPYTSGEQLVKWSKEHPDCKTLFCHQTFDGSQYENGFYAGDGVKPEDIVQTQIISGHIHAPQEFGKVWYPGAPRWRTLSDANVERAVWLIDTDATGEVTSRTPFATGSFCRRIYHLIDTPEAPIDQRPAADNPHEYRVDSKGPAAWLETRRAVFEGWARWRPVRTDPRVSVAVKESDGVPEAFTKWVDSYQPKHGTSKEVLTQLVKERLHGW